MAALGMGVVFFLCLVGAGVLIKNVRFGKPPENKESDKT